MINNGPNGTKQKKDHPHERNFLNLFRPRTASTIKEAGKGSPTPGPKLAKELLSYPRL